MSRMYVSALQYSVLVQGVSRVRLLSLSEEEPLLQGTVVRLFDQGSTADAEVSDCLCLGLLCLDGRSVDGGGDFFFYSMLGEGCLCLFEAAHYCVHLFFFRTNRRRAHRLFFCIARFCCCCVLVWLGLFNVQFYFCVLIFRQVDPCRLP